MGRRRGVRSLVSNLLVATIALAVPSAMFGFSAAAFTAATGSSANSFAVDALAAPTGVSASGGASITLNWTATSDTYADGHRVYRSSAAGGPYTQIAQLTPRTTTAYVDSPATGTYYYVIRAFDGAWESVDSAEVSAFAGEVSLLGSWQTGTSHTASTGTNRLLVFIAGNEHFDTSTPTLSSVSYGGRAMTKLTNLSAVSYGRSGGLEIWTLDEAGIAAASGTTIVPSWNSTPSTALYSHAMFSGVDQTTSTGALSIVAAPDDFPNPVPLSSLATADDEMIVVGATAGETGSYTPQGLLTLGNTQENTIDTVVLSTAHQTTDGSSVTPSMLFNSDSVFINRQVAGAFVLKVVQG